MTTTGTGGSEPGTTRPNLRQQEDGSTEMGARAAALWAELTDPQRAAVDRLAALKPVTSRESVLAEVMRCATCQRWLAGITDEPAGSPDPAGDEDQGDADDGRVTVSREDLRAARDAIATAVMPGTRSQLGDLLARLSAAAEVTG